MKYVRKNKFILGLLFAAILGLAIFTIGGEYLHSRIHHHESQDAQQQCPVFRFKAQALTVFVTLSVALFFKVIASCFILDVQPFTFQSNNLLPEFRAPPR